MKDPRHHLAAGRIREVLRSFRPGRLHVPCSQRCEQARNSRRDRADLLREGHQGQHPQSARQDQDQPAAQHLRSYLSDQARARHPCRGRRNPVVRVLSPRITIHMAVRRRNPTSAGRRFQTVHDYSEATRSSRSRWSPRSRRRAAATTKAACDGPPSWWRQQDTLSHHRFQAQQRRRSRGVASIEYDPTALSHRAVALSRRRKAPHPCAAGFGVGDRVLSGQGSEIRPGNALPLRFIPVGTVVHNVELRPGGGGKMGRSGGNGRPIDRQRERIRDVRLPSTEMRRVSIDCRATVGEVGNSEHELIKVGKAGRKRWKGVRPQTAVSP